MRTLIFSDTHLTPIFEPARFNALAELIRSVDQVIINGDFWDGYYCTFSSFLNSKWSALFPLLLQKQTIYLYGNHDTEQFCDERVNLFSVRQAVVHLLQVGDQRLDIRHGHHIDTQNPLFHADIIFRNSSPFIRRAYRTLCYVRDKNILVLSEIYRRYLRRSDSYDDVVLQRYAENHMEQNQVLVCGHSHIQRDVRASKYLNTGRFEFGRAEYGLVEGGVIRLVAQAYL
ncbi:MAG: metallophosphoesterase family protein [bacterium]|nr:metallophosphoesterase family protein [bacterium]